MFISRSFSLLEIDFFNEDVFVTVIFIIIIIIINLFQFGFKDNTKHYD